MGSIARKDFIEIKVAREDPDTREGRKFQTFTVPFTQSMRVLDAIKWIKDHEDGTLGFRWNCGMGLCGSCAMEVNGVPVLTCKTELKKSIFATTITPMRAFPVIKDLVADYSQIYEDEKKLNLWFEGKIKGKFLKYFDSDISDVRKFRSCIECMVCIGNCKPKIEDKQKFIGPKSIVKAMAYDLHPKDTLDRSKLLEEGGLWHCAQTRCCQRNCPEDIPITDSGINPAQSRAKKKR